MSVATAIDTLSDYHAFLNKKSHVSGKSGFAPLWMPEWLFDFQQFLLGWALETGRSAIFADCGFGKTPMQLVWAQNVVEKTNRPVLIATPLAVSHQTVREAKKFNIECELSRNGKHGNGIVVTNYERLHYFDWQRFSGMVCDESGILKNFEGATKEAITDFMRKLQYRLLCTATPAPNDFIELGTSSEALGGLGYMDMLSMFFKNDQNSLHPSNRGRHDNAWYSGKFRFKNHAKTSFWRWVCSWSRACRRPSDFGFDDGQFVLPALNERTVKVEASRPMDGFLFPMPAKGLDEQRQERRHTMKERCEMAAECVSHDDFAIVWCHLNPEGDLLEKLIPNCVQISGKDSDESKEEKFEAFLSGEAKKLVTKPDIGAWGLNFQHCNHMTIFPSHSFEQYYQSVRRCWRFGQKRPVHVDVITTAGESDVLENLKRKARAADELFSSIVAEMRNQLTIERSEYGTKQEEVPLWLKA